MRQRRLLDVLASLFPVTLPRQRLFRALLFAGLQIEGVTLYLFDNVLLLHFALEAPQSAFERFAILDMDFSQLKTHPLARITFIITHRLILVLGRGPPVYPERRGYRPSIAPERPRVVSRWRLAHW